MKRESRREDKDKKSINFEENEKNQRSSKAIRKEKRQKNFVILYRKIKTGLEE